MLLLANYASSSYSQFNLEDSDDRPTHFKDGLLTYVKVDYEEYPETVLQKFLLCTSCTISYIKGIAPTGATKISTDPVSMIFKEGLEAVPVDFYNMKLQMISNDEVPVTYSWSMDIGYIADKYFTTTEYPDANYGLDFYENMLGLAPMSDSELYDERRFLSQFT